MMNNFYGMTYQPGIDESKIDRLTLDLSLCSFRGARTYDAGLKLCCVCDMFEKRDVNGRGELWIIEAFHLANLPTIDPSLAYKIVAARRGYGVTGFMQPFSFLLFISSLAFALPAKSAEHKLLTSDNFWKTISKGYW
jgi:hypothetical protein